MIVDLVDGTYELFRHFYGQRRFNDGKDKPLAAVVGVLHSLLEIVEHGGVHVGVATDHVIESFRNALWSGYKTGAGIDAALLAQFHPLEEAIALLGIPVWPMTELEADDALASAAAIAGRDETVETVRIWTSDKDLAQCVREGRVVQVDRRARTVRDAAGVKAKFGVGPVLIPDWLALVGDAADGYPGMAGIGRIGAAALLAKYGPIESFPEHVLGSRRAEALLFKRLATLRTDAPLFSRVSALHWRGPTPGFATWAAHADAPRLAERAARAREAMGREGRGPATGRSRVGSRRSLR